MRVRSLLLFPALGLFVTYSFAARTGDGVTLPDCDPTHPACVEWRQAVRTMNSDAANLGAASAERPGKPSRSGPAYLKSVDACIKYQVAAMRMTQTAARARCEKLMSKTGQL